jgi:uncharacterized phage protein gp47/JayE
MGFDVPSLDDISADLTANMEAELSGSAPAIWPNNLRIVLKSLAPAFRAAYVRMAWLYDQAFVSTAATEALERKGADFGVTRLPASYATGYIRAVTTVGAFIPQGTRILEPASGLAFEVTSDTTATETVTMVPVVAEDTGPLYNLIARTKMAYQTSPGGVSSAEVGTGGLTGGSDIETDASLRDRVLAKMRTAPHGGSPSEWIGWALQCPGVTNVFVQRATPAPGAVTILFMMYAVYANGIPAAADATGLLALLRESAPADADIQVVCPMPISVDVTVHIEPNMPADQERVRTELTAMFRRRAAPGSPTTPFSFSRSWAVEAVSIAMGDATYDVQIPTDDIICGKNQVAVLGTVTFK